MEAKPSDDRVSLSSQSSESIARTEPPSRTFPPPTGKSLLRRYLLYGRTTLTLFCAGATCGAAAFWYLTSSLDEKLGGIYSKSTPHRLERRKHLYVDKSTSGSSAADPIINEVDEEEEEEEEDLGGTEREVADGAVDVRLTRLKEGALKFFNKTKRDISLGLEKAQELVTSDKYSFFRRDDPDTLMRIALSSNQMAWKFGVEALATMPHHDWRNDDFWRVAQALDPKSIIALSEYSDVDLRFFLPVKFPNRTKKRNLYVKLRTLLADLPLENVDVATKYFTEQALKFADEERKDQNPDDENTRSYGDSFLGGEHLEYDEAVKHITVTPKEKKELSCLQAFFCHSKLENNHDVFIKTPILPYLLELISSVDCDNVKLMVAQIVGNVACRPDAISPLVLSGWIGVLVKWRQSEGSSFRLQLEASRALVNIHGSFFLSQQVSKDGKKSNRVPCLMDGVYAYDPVQSFFTGDFEADVVFVHGLLGGAAFTWRQSVACDDAEKELSGEKPKGTCPGGFSNCWPKDWLSKDLNKVRMFGVEYSTQLSDWEPVHPYETPEDRTIPTRAKELLVKLEAADVGKKRPVIWVTHSMGGLLVKEILRLAEKRHAEDDILVNSCGVIFYGTPHKGSPLANISTNFFYIVFPTIEVQELSYTNIEYLDSLNKHFGKLVGRGLQSLSFAELKPTLLGDFLSDSVSIHLVPPESANPNYGHFIPVDTDHMNICKPSGRVDCYLYAMTLNFIKDCVEKRIIRSALKIASSAVAADADVNAEETDGDRYHLDHDLWH